MTSALLSTLMANYHWKLSLLTAAGTAVVPFVMNRLMALNPTLQAAQQATGRGCAAGDARNAPRSGCRETGNGARSNKRNRDHQDQGNVSHEPPPHWHVQRQAKRQDYASVMYHNHHASFNCGNYGTISLFYDWIFGTVDKSGDLGAKAKPMRKVVPTSQG